MSTTMTPEVREIIDRAMKLLPTEREFVALQLLDSVEQPPNSYESPEALRAELKRRVEAVENGTMKTYSIEETMEHLRQVAAEGNPK